MFKTDNHFIKLFYVILTKITMKVIFVGPYIIFLLEAVPLIANKIPAMPPPTIQYSAFISSFILTIFNMC